MRGMTLLAMLTAFLFLIGISFVAAAVLIQMYTIQNLIGSQQTYTLTVRGVHLPTVYQDLLMVALDSHGGEYARALANASLYGKCTDGQDDIIWYGMKCSDVFTAIGTAIYNSLGNEANIYLIWQSDKGSKNKYISPTATLGEKININKVVYVPLPNSNYKLILYVVKSV